MVNRCCWLWYACQEAANFLFPFCGVQVCINIWFPGLNPQFRIKLYHENVLGIGRKRLLSFWSSDHWSNWENTKNYINRKSQKVFFFAIMCVHSQKTSANLKSHDGRGREGGVDSSEMARFWRPSTEDLRMGSGFLLHLVLKFWVFSTLKVL